jgi:hypothetical protein
LFVEGAILVESLGQGVEVGFGAVRVFIRGYSSTLLRWSKFTGLFLVGRAPFMDGIYSQLK